MNFLNLTIWLLFLGCTNNASTPTTTQILERYLSSSFKNESILKGGKKYKILLYTKRGCSSCSEALESNFMINTNPNLIVITDQKQLKNLKNSRLQLYFDTIGSNLTRVNIGTVYSSVYVEYKDSIINYESIDGRNINDVLKKITKH